jgi:cardiolipin synthase (CMP-forming)
VAECPQRVAQPMHVGVEVVGRGVGVGRAEVEVVHTVGGEHVQMDVRHLEAGDHQADASRGPHAELRVADGMRDTHRVRGGFGGQVGPSIDLGDRHDERMAGGERTNVDPRHDRVVAPDEPAGYLSVDDASEDRGHDGIVGCRLVATPDETRASSAPVGEREGLGVLTVPNAVTIVRLAALPLFLYLLFGRDDRAGAAYVLGAIGATDWLDGYLARRLGQISTFGKVLDPTADRVVFFVGVVALLIDGSVPTGFAVATLVREGLVAIVALVLAAAGARRIDVTFVGKSATFGLLVAYPLFLAGASDVFFHRPARALAWFIGIPSLFMSYYAAARYVPIARSALERRRNAKSPSHEAV